MLVNNQPLTNQTVRLIDCLWFNATFSTVRLYRSFNSRTRVSHFNPNPNAIAKQNAV